MSSEAGRRVESGAVWKRVLRRTLLLLAAVQVTGCVPPFSEMQSARTVSPRAFEATTFYSSVSTAEGGEREKAYNQFGLLLAMGASERVDIRARIERQAVSGEPDDALTVVGVGPKIALVPERDTETAEETKEAMAAA